MASEIYVTSGRSKLDVTAKKWYEFENRISLAPGRSVSLPGKIRYAFWQIKVSHGSRIVLTPGQFFYITSIPYINLRKD